MAGNFSMVVARRPVSASGGTNPRYQMALRERAKRFCPEKLFLSGNLYLRVTWFHKGARGGQDVDNILKPIGDSLKDVVYVDGILVSQVLGVAIDTGRDFELPSDLNAEDQTVREQLQNLLAEGERHILYIEVGRVNAQRIAFGSIDGDN